MTSAAADSPPQSVEDEELASVQSEGLGALFGELGLSMLVSTYQAAKLIVARQDASGLLNTHYRTLRKPMGIAVGREQVAVGVAGEIVFYSNTPANCAKLPGDQLHDACYVPRSGGYPPSCAVTLRVGFRLAASTSLPSAPKGLPGIATPCA